MTEYGTLGLGWVGTGIALPTHPAIPLPGYTLPPGQAGPRVYTGVGPGVIVPWGSNPSANSLKAHYSQT